MNDVPEISGNMRLNQLGGNAVAQSGPQRSEGNRLSRLVTSGIDGLVRESQSRTGVESRRTDNAQLAAAIH